MKIALVELELWEQDHLIPKLNNDKLVFLNRCLTKKNVEKIKDCEVVCCFVFSKLTKEILDKLPKLKLIATLSTGFDHIDLEECKRRGIIVCNVPIYGENTVAEHAMALILAIVKKIPQSYEKTVRGNFSRDGLRTFDLKGKTVGVVGVGNIGRHVVRMCRSFEMNVLAFDLNKDEKFAKDFNFKYVEMDELLRNSDIITLHCPLNKHTSHLISMKEIKMMKKGVYLINTSRGEIVDTKALIYGLQKKIIAGAGLDVLEEECHIVEDKEVISPHFPKVCNTQVLLENHILLKQENVLITPHNAFNSWEALRRILDTSVDNIEAFRKGKPINTVKLEKN